MVQEKEVEKDILTIPGILFVEFGIDQEEISPIHNIGKLITNSDNCYLALKKEGIQVVFEVWGTKTDAIVRKGSPLLRICAQRFSDQNRIYLTTCTKSIDLNYLWFTEWLIKVINRTCELLSSGEYDIKVEYMPIL